MLCRTNQGLWLGLLITSLCVTGCAEDTPSVTGSNLTTSTATAAENEFGQFLEPLEMRVESDGKTFTLTKDFGYIDAQGKQWDAPTGSRVDGATIPRLLYTVVGSPMTGKYRMASVVHDVACIQKTEPWKETHRMFYEACRCGGVGDSKAKMMYWAVYHFGDRWRLEYETRMEKVMEDGKMVERPNRVSRFIEEPRQELDEATLEKAKTYFEEHELTLEQIEDLTF
ncbi:MAG: hypothetical protein COA78_38715 [Blastopirellula sp.]|nr:MAG: hypothetical protein COA78_38715 [Blastopirellula sp.]